jgi:predicted dehydrogenase
MTARIAILGTGWGLRIQLPAFRHAGLAVTALWSRDEARARALARDFGIPFASSRVDAVLARHDVDLVSIVTPPAGHLPLALATLAAGKHVLGEKPMALNADEAVRMTAAAAERPDQLALIDHELRLLPGRRRLRAELHAGRIGAPRHVAITYRTPMRVDPTSPWTWWSDVAQGGGILNAIGSHMVDQVAWATGQPIVAARARLSILTATRPDEHGVSRPVTADDVALADLRLADGSTAHLDIHTGQPGTPTNLMRVDGDTGSLLWDGSRLTVSTPGGGPETLPADDGVALPPGLPNTEWAHGSVRLGHALRTALTAGPPITLPGAATFADGLAAQRALDAMRVSSAAGGEWVDLPRAFGADRATR